MSLIIMRFLNFAALLMAGMLAATGLAADEGGFDFESLEVASGSVYREVLILDADEHGLMFRHRGGIAKLPFSQFSENLRMLYEPVAAVPELADAAPDEESRGEDGVPVGQARDRESGETSPAFDSAWPESISLTARARVEVSPGTIWTGGFRGDPRAGLATWPRYRAPWRPAWGRYPRSLSLANPFYRELVVRDFLITTGLIPAPPGFRPYPIPKRVPCDPFRPVPLP